MPTDRPYPLTTERDDDGSYTVSDDVTLCWGHGATPEEALADYDETLAEWREIDRQGDGMLTAMAERQRRSGTGAPDAARPGPQGYVKPY